MTTARARGFTMIELLVTIAIIGLLMGLSIGIIGKVRHESYVKETESVLNFIKVGLGEYQGDYGDYPWCDGLFELGNSDSHARATTAVLYHCLHDGYLANKLPTRFVKYADLNGHGSKAIGGGGPLCATRYHPLPSALPDGGPCAPAGRQWPTTHPAWTRCWPGSSRHAPRPSATWPGPKRGSPMT